MLRLHPTKPTLNPELSLSTLLNRRTHMPPHTPWRSLIHTCSHIHPPPTSNPSCLLIHTCSHMHSPPTPHTLELTVPYLPPPLTTVAFIVATHVLPISVACELHTDDLHNTWKLADTQTAVPSEQRGGKTQGQFTLWRREIHQYKRPGCESLPEYPYLPGIPSSGFQECRCVVREQGQYQEREKAVCDEGKSPVAGEGEGGV